MPSIPLPFLAGRAFVLATMVSFAARAEQPNLLIADFKNPMLFSYGTWQDKTPINHGALLLHGINGRGGAGRNDEIDVSGYQQFSPVLRIKVDADNKGRALRLSLGSSGGRTSTWWYDLPEKSSDTFDMLTPRDSASLAEPSAVDEKTGAADLSKITQMQLQGDWADRPLSIAIDRVELVAPTQEMIAARAAVVRRKSDAAAAARKAKAEALAGITHTAMSPAVDQVCAISADILSIRIQAGRLVTHLPEKYVPQPGDEIRDPDNNTTPVWDNGKIIDGPNNRQVWRQGKEGRKLIGLMVGGRDAGTAAMFKPGDDIVGDKLEVLTVDDPSSYTVAPANAGAPAAAPAAVYRKSVPDNRAEPDGDQLAMRHTVYLKLATPMVEGKTYTIHFPGLNVSSASVDFTYDSRTARSEAIHVSHVGYRPSDPFKRAMLSLWLGTGGAYTFDFVKQFELLDDSTGRVVFTGVVEPVLAADGTEKLREEKNYSQTAVYALDFSKFATPGRFRIRVPGVGCSYPFSIDDHAWETAFKVSMSGFLHQRTGLALEEPFSDYLRPRPMHPADGQKVFKTNVSMAEAMTQNGGDWFVAMTKHRTDTLDPNAWGGYMDAGDWDPNSNHMLATQLQLELFDLFPDYYSKIKLSLPPDEANNTIPDLLDEALWNVGLFERTQHPDGGIIGAIDSSAHPRAGEASWENSLVVSIASPDPDSSYIYAGTAARLSRLLNSYDKAHADHLAESAQRAWNYAESHSAEFVAKVGKPYSQALTEVRPLAAVEMFKLTGNSEFDAAAQKEFLTATPQVAMFDYATLPAGKGDDVLKQRCRQVIVAAADRSLAFGAGNAFGITTDSPNLPEIGWIGYFSTPGMITQPLPMAHYLTGDTKYLVGTLRSCNFSVGANPNNMSYTTGIGPVYPGAVLHIDSRVTGQPAPSGITVYGQTDPSRGDSFNEWVHIWVIGKVTVPASRSWPATEAYVDLYKWPSMNEFTIRQTMGPTSFTWGYLAARP